MKHKILAALTFLTGVALSGSAAFYSILGLTSIFPGARIPVIVLGANLEVAKLVAVSWLYHNWKDTSKTLKALLTISTIILMLITSMGIFGFLSRAHIEQQLLVQTGVVDKITSLDAKIKIKEEQQKDIDKQIGVIDTAVDKLTEKGQVKSALSTSTTQKGNRSDLIAQKQKIIEDISPLKEEMIVLQSEIKKQEAEIGPIKYVAELIYGDTDEKILDKSVRFVILLLIIVFDPLAILLLLAFNISLHRTGEYGIEFVEFNNEHMMKTKKRGATTETSDYRRRSNLTTRPWGYWEVIEEGPGYKIKRLVIQPKQSISNQYHNHRSETWCIIGGEGQLFLEDKLKTITKGDVFTIEIGEKHRVKNISETEDLVAIEVQMGEKCEEDDIVRL